MKKGMTILEVLVASIMLAIIVASIFPIIGWLTTKSKEKQYDGQASTIMAAGVEVAYNALLGDWDAYHAGIVGSPEVYHPAVDIGTGGWVLDDGEELVEARYTRRIEVVEVCRQESTGERIMGICGAGAAIDANSRMVTSIVSWKERGSNKEISANLLLTRI